MECGVVQGDPKLEWDKRLFHLPVAVIVDAEILRIGQSDHHQMSSSSKEGEFSDARL